jgi:hypothetical protein
VRRIRLHWFWRGTIAVVVACTYGGLAVTVFEGPHQHLARLIETELDRNVTTQPAAMGLGVAIAWFCPVVLLALAVYGGLTRLNGHAERDNETRCRKCDYILRGITEPRCPECGERI